MSFAPAARNNKKAGSSDPQPRVRPPRSLLVQGSRSDGPAFRDATCKTIGLFCYASGAQRHPSVVPAKAGTQPQVSYLPWMGSSLLKTIRRWLWVPAFAGTR